MMIHKLFGERRLTTLNLNLHQTIEKANITKLLFIRHGQTAPIPDTGLDYDRVLTDMGRTQAKRSGEIFGKNLQPYFSPALVSPAPRTMETAQLFLAASTAVVDESDNDSSVEEIEFLPVNSLYDGTQHPKGDLLFQKLGYAPLRDYLENENEQMKDNARLVLGNYAENIIESIIKTIESSTAIENGSNDIEKTLLIAAHAIYLPAAALGVASLLGCDNNSSSSSSLPSPSMEVILSTNTKEVEGYLIDAKNHSVRYLSRD
ncbi:hypothetical protein FRACYDRAFT_244461 [Fragilariopsis cylindrus CCMP1102]|uniref:Serine/threonine-protein phosphatase PGAM5, mitochondrial n=1 Tax=Fragilariopsis cylindrus CCMP1102 TaxID=635003 RepID=A0A1E7F2Y0_9STRA|nr:hypothetical protein FRACYDRAFT_244461 [Fragilariopsis cylindrus CCMP1102]|eukprot:OEU12203.1 hypothetical protein FRACYDRAFT_244461 [Fragilariopsis cylindrus CCMP1102]